MLALSAAVVLSCLTGAGFLIYGKQQLDQRLQTEPFRVETTAAAAVPAIEGGNTVTTNTAVPETFPPAAAGAQNFLITGSDANACVEPDSPWAGAADPDRENIGSRSDTIMVMRVDPAARRAAVLSFPRDLWVKIPGRGKSRINSAYVKDDYSLLAQTIYDNFGIVVDHYVQVDFCAFKRIVDAVGGVTVPFATRIVDPTVQLDVPAGCHTFSGDEALAYARSRHLRWVDENGRTHEDRFADLGRISRQQDLLRRMLQAALDKGLFDPAVARALVSSLQSEIVTEHGFTINDMLGLAGVFEDIDPASIRTYQIETSRLIVSDNDVLAPQIKGEHMVAVLNIFRGLTPPPVAAPLRLPTVTPAAVPDDTTPTTVAVPTTIAEPEQNLKADILPDDSITC